MMNVSELTNDTEIQAQIQGLIDGTIDPERYESVQNRIRECYGKPDRVDLVLTAIDGLLGMHGIEPIRFGDNVAALHINAGDTYAATVIYDCEKKQYEINSWAEYLEVRWVTAEYVDTCISCYLQSSYAGDGEWLLLAMCHGQTRSKLAEELIYSFDDYDAPEWVCPETMRDAIYEAIEGVDTRAIDPDGNRVEDPEGIDPDELAEGPYIYVVIRWNTEV